MVANINKNMEFEDSRNALFVEPNAYIQKFDNCKSDKEVKKIVFQEPYETLPNHYLNNNFKKHDCDCVSKSHKPNKHDCSFNDKKNFNNHDNNCNHTNKQTGFSFDMKSLLPFLGLFNKGGGADLSNLVGMLNNGNNLQNNNSSPISLISSLMSNKDMMSGILNLFKGGGLNFFNKKQATKKEIKTTDFEIKNYTRVE